jgi:hypothetical protein
MTDEKLRPVFNCSVFYNDKNEKKVIPVWFREYHDTDMKI